MPTRLLYPSFNLLLNGLCKPQVYTNRTMCVYRYICKYVCVCVDMCMYVCIYVCVYVFVCVLIKFQNIQIAYKLHRCVCKVYKYNVC